jgi:hypothetical protein
MAVTEVEVLMHIASGEVAAAGSTGRRMGTLAQFKFLLRRWMMVKKSVFYAALAAAAVLVGAPAAAHAQNRVDQQAEIAVTVPINAYLNLSTSSVTIPTPTAADVAAGRSRPATLTMSYGSNGLIALSYRFPSGGALVGAGGSSFAVGGLLLSVDGGQEEVMSQFNDAWRSNIPAGDYTETLSITMPLSWNVKPDTYTGVWEATIVGS